jgi:glycosyltransferase involved in cell wall biosynthesis
MYYGLSMGRAVEKSTRVIAVSKTTSADISRNFDPDSSKVQTIYPGIDPIFTNQADTLEDSAVRSRYRLPQEYILYVGNIEPKKNIAGLLRAYKILKERGVRHKLVLVGKRTWRSESVWHDISENFGRGDVVVTGYVEREHLPAIYRMAGVFAFVSLYEGFGFPPLEAMACGTPVVSSGRGALAETTGKSAMIVEPEDVEAIAEAIYSLLSNAELCQRHIQPGLNEVRRFCPERSARETLSIYREAAGSND